MFNKIFEIDNSINFPDSIDVNKVVYEYRAPTDKSIELLNDFHEKTLENILFKTSVNNNLNCEWIIFKDLISTGLFCHGLVVINGEKYNFDFKIPHDIEVQQNYAAVADMVKEELGKIITNVCLEDFLKANVTWTRAGGLNLRSGHNVSSQR